MFKLLHSIDQTNHHEYNDKSKWIETNGCTNENWRKVHLITTKPNENILNYYIYMIIHPNKLRGRECYVCFVFSLTIFVSMKQVKGL